MEFSNEENSMIMLPSSADKPQLPPRPRDNTAGDWSKITVTKTLNHSQDPSSIFTSDPVISNPNPNGGSSSASTILSADRNSKINIKQSMEEVSIAQTSYEVGAAVAASTVSQIEEDKIRTRSIIAEYGVDPTEMLYLGKNYELLDVPGFDSPIKEHRDAGLRAVKIADAFVFLTNGQQPSLTEPQICLLREIQQNQFGAMERAFGIITKLDLCQTAEKYQEHYMKAAQELLDKNFKSERVYAACPRLQTLNPGSEEFRVIDHKVHHFGEELANGFENSKHGLKNFIEFELPKTHLKQLFDIGRMQLTRLVLERLQRIKEKQLLPENIMKMSIDDYVKEYNIEKWDELFREHIFSPMCRRAHTWHTTVITKERSKFLAGVKKNFYNTFMERTKQFMERRHPVEDMIFEMPNYAKIHLNTHPIDNSERESLCAELEKIVDKSSDILAEYFYHQYICQFENILNEVCPQLRDLFRSKLTIEKCRNETHALVLRVCRPIIIAALRFSHTDLEPKRDAIRCLINCAPIVAFRVVNFGDGGRDNGIFDMEILNEVEQLSGKNTATAIILKALFKK
ncbi:unnamed protein product [Rotaria sp. Silwood2]|nr:unnamed protein product [Rotaria sp. Silwood2]